MPVAAFKQGLKIAIEEVGGIAPNSSTNGAWFQGGRWMPVTTDGFPSLQDRQQVIFPAGAAGNRNRNARGPVRGRAWSDGGFSFPVTEDFLGAILYAALGTASTNSVPSTDATLASGAPLTDGTNNAIDLSSQPSDGGAILRFAITDTSAGATVGWISISGIDSDGNGASEMINIASAGNFYSRNSYSAIGPSSIVIYTLTDASVAITGWKYWVHTFSPGPSNPTMSIEKLGDPTAGAASKAHLHTSMVVTELTLNSPAEQRDGLFTGNVMFEGPPTVTCNATSQLAASRTEVWPAWGLSVSRDSIAWSNITNNTISIGAGNRNFRTAAGVRGPQGSFFGPREVTGSFNILVDNEIEYNRWLGASEHAIILNWDTPHKLTSTQNQALTAWLSKTYLEEPDQGEDNDAFSLSADFRTIEDADKDVITFQLINGIPGTAYGTGVA